MRRRRIHPMNLTNVTHPSFWMVNWVDGSDWLGNNTVRSTGRWLRRSAMYVHPPNEPYKCNPYFWLLNLVDKFYKSNFLATEFSIFYGISHVIQNKRIIKSFKDIYRLYLVPIFLLFLLRYTLITHVLTILYTFKDISDFLLMWIIKSFTGIYQINCYTSLLKKFNYLKFKDIKIQRLKIKKLNFKL